MDIDRVRYFNAVAETGSLVRASEILHISQPALSKALRLLESEIGLKLLEPDGRGIRLTETGWMFHRQTAPMMAEWLDVPRRLRDSRTWTPTKIGSFEVFTTHFLARLAEDMDLRNLEIHEYGPGRLEKEIAEGQIHIGITYVPVPRQGVEFVEVTKVKMGLFGVRGKFQAMEFAELPFVIPLLPPEGTPSKVVGLDGWPDHRLERKVEFRVAMMESALALARRGLCVAYLPEFIVEIHNESVKSEFALTELNCPIPRRERLQSVYLVQRKGMPETTLHRKLAKSLRALD